MPTSQVSKENVKHYVDHAGLVALIGQIKKADAADKLALEKTIGVKDADGAAVTMKIGDTTYTDMKSYVDAQAAVAQGDITYSNADATTIAVGGIAKGSSFENKTVKQMLDMLLYPYVAITGGSLSMTPANTTAKEVGESVTVTTSSVSYTKGSTACTKAEVFDASGTSIGSTANPTASPATVDITDTEINPTVAANASSGTYTFTAKVTDANDTTVASGSYKYTFYRPYYIGSTDAIPTTADEITGLTKSVASLPSAITANTTANKYWVLAYPASYSDVKATKGVVDANGFDVTGNLVKQANINITGKDGATVAYKVYAGLKGTADAKFTVNR